MSKILALKVVLFIVLVIPLVALAQNSSIPVPDVGLPIGSPNADITGTIALIIRNILLPIVGVIAVLFIIIGGFQIMLSGANEDLAKRGKTTLTNALIGLIVVLLSYVVITVVVNTLLKLP